MIGSRLRVSRGVGFAFVTILAAGTAVQAGVNMWTGGRPPQYGQPQEFAPTLMATDPRDPYVVYAAFQPSLYKSRDGGRTWTRLATFLRIDALLVHPAAPDTLYAGVYDGPNGEFGGVVKSSDGGDTWVRKPFDPDFPFWGPVYALAGSPTDVNTVYASAWSLLFGSTDGGETWHQGAYLSGVIASLVVPKRDTREVYSGTESDFYYYPFGAFARSSDAGLTFTTSVLEPVDNVAAIAVDPAQESTVFIGLSGSRPEAPRGVLRSNDSGVTFSRADAGLRLGANVSSLAIDPANPSTLYAGTDAGVYRSRDSGGHWSSIGRLLSGVAIESLAISGDGRRIHAGTDDGAFDLELVAGPVDVAATPGGGARILRWNGDRLAVQTVDGSNNWTASPFSATSETWTGVAIAAAADGVVHVLWQNGDGRSAVETRYSSGASSVLMLPSPVDWFPSDLSVGSDGRVRLLFTGANGRMHLATIRADGFVSRGPLFPPAAGWTAVSFDAAPDGSTWVLWRSSDGRGAVSIHGDGPILATVKWGATPGWWVEDLAVRSDGRARVLARNVAGAMQVWTVGEDGSRNVGATHESPGLVPRRIAAGADGLTRVLWGGDHGEGTVWFLTDSGNFVSVEVPVLP